MISLSLIRSLTNIIFGFIEGILGIRILLKFFAANPVAPFVEWIYTTSKPLLAPFEGMFPTETLARGFVIEISTLFALLVYAFVGSIIEEGIWYLGSAKNNRLQKNKESE